LERKGRCHPLRVFTSEVRIGPGKIALLEAIRSTGSIRAAARSIAMSYRRALLLVDDINHALRKPAVTAQKGGSEGGATLTRVGEQFIRLHHKIESLSCQIEFQLIQVMCWRDCIWSQARSCATRPATPSCNSLAPFGVWLLSERLTLSPIITVVTYAMTLALLWCASASHFNWKTTVPSDTVGRAVPSLLAFLGRVRQ
jgi:molybdate transport system regulatory protein